MAQAMNDPMPKWIRKHLKAGVRRTRKRVKRMHALVQGQNLKTSCPPELIPAWDRMHLMKMVA